MDVDMNSEQDNNELPDDGQIEAVEKLSKENYIKWNSK